MPTAAKNMTPKTNSAIDLLLLTISLSYRALNILPNRIRPGAVRGNSPLKRSSEGDLDFPSLVNFWWINNITILGSVAAIYITSSTLFSKQRGPASWPGCPGPQAVQTVDCHCPYSWVLGRETPGRGNLRIMGRWPVTAS